MISLKAVVIDGRIRLDEPERMREYAKTLGEGREVELTVRPWSAGRSLRANALFHSILARYAKANGERMEKVKLDFKRNFGVWVKADAAMKSPPTWRGTFADYYGEVIFLKSTADYTIREFKELTDGLVSECHDSGVEIGDILEGAEK